jgi:hypothetical protein
MIEKEFRRAIQYVSLSDDNGDTYSDFFVKIILQIGSEIDVVAKALCKEINPRSTADKIDKYRSELLQTYPEIEFVTVKCNDITTVPWKSWSSSSPAWWKIYNGIKHNRGDFETYDGVTKENFKFANLSNTVASLSGLYLFENYLYKHVIDANPHLDTPIPGSRLFVAMDHGWENKRTYKDSGFFFDNERLVYIESDLFYGDL